MPPWLCWQVVGKFSWLEQAECIACKSDFLKYE